MDLGSSPAGAANTLTSTKSHSEDQVQPGQMKAEDSGRCLHKDTEACNACIKRLRCIQRNCDIQLTDCAFSYCDRARLNKALT